MKQTNDKEEIEIIPSVQLRGTFSERNNLSLQNQILQTTDLDYRTRYKIFDRIKSIIHYFSSMDSNYKRYETLSRFYNSLLREVYLKEIDYTIEHYNDDYFFENYFKPTIFKDEYYKIFDVLEFTCSELSYLFDDYISMDEKNFLYEIFNNLFEEEKVGYRFLNKIIIPTTDENELKSLEETANSKFISINKHIKKAIQLFSDRNNPDFDNSIKESISAVEAVCKIITKSEKATLGEALNAIQKTDSPIPTPLKNAFSAIYGYTSDGKNGIRHSGGLFEKDSSFEEAKYMLISCSAFINYLISFIKDE